MIFCLIANTILLTIDWCVKKIQHSLHMSLILCFNWKSSVQGFIFHQQSSSILVFLNWLFAILLQHFLAFLPLAYFLTVSLHFLTLLVADRLIFLLDRDIHLLFCVPIPILLLI